MIRRACLDDVGVLFDMEKQASIAALAHVFAPDIAFPDSDVLARWCLVFEEPGMTVLIDQSAGVPIGYAAVADGWLRHFGVVPAWWGTGRAQRIHSEALAELAAQGAQATYLWVLVDNHRAKRFYERAGWRDTGVREDEVFAPYPVKMQMVRT